jgi:hypothetical protein
VPDDLIRGRLGDVALVGFCEKPRGREFRLVFFELRTAFDAEGRLVPDRGPATGVVHAPVVLYPENAKRLAAALSQNVARFLARFGAAQAPQSSEGGFLHEVDASAAAVYANLIMVNHRPSEFTLDFLFVPPNPPFARVVQRIILAPGVAVALAADLERVVGEYEARFGPIPLTPFPGAPIVH